MLCCDAGEKGRPRLPGSWTLVVEVSRVTKHAVAVHVADTPLETARGLGLVAVFVPYAERNRKQLHGQSKASFLVMN